MIKKWKHTGSAEISDKHNIIFKCDQCEQTLKSDTGIKVHTGRTHGKLTLKLWKHETVTEEVQSTARRQGKKMIKNS